MDKSDRLVPPGFSLQKELKMSAGFVGGAALVLILGFFLSYMAGVEGMYSYVSGRRVETPHAVFPACRTMLIPGAVAFILSSAAFLWMLFRHISYHYRGGSRCIYTMRRLPRKSELAVRCGALPVFGLLASQLSWRLLVLACGRIYMGLTPDRWLAADAWEQIIHLVTH